MIQRDDSDEFYDQEGAPGEAHARIPRWLWLSYLAVIVWGVIWWFLFWNGSDNHWLDRGAWTSLQHAAKTTFPFEQPHPND